MSENNKTMQDLSFDTDAEASFQHFYTEAEKQATDNRAEPPESADTSGSDEVEGAEDAALKNLSDYEKECYAKGWRPDKELSAKAWARQEDLISDVATSHKQLKKYSKTISKLNEEIKKLSDKLYSQDVESLRAQKERALANNDSVTAAQYDKAIEEVRPIKQEIPQELEDFKDRNSDWFLEDTSTKAIRMRAYAKLIEQELSTSGLSLADGLQRIEDAVKEQFPEYFNKAESVPEEKAVRKQSVESGTQIVLAKSRNRVYNVSDLDADQKRVLEASERAGIIRPNSDYTREMFIQQCKGQK